MAKLTAWFNSEEHSPVRVGVYLSTVDKRETFYRYWDGCEWHVGGCTPNDAAIEAGYRRGNGGLHWRGLAKEPK
jgi:hypothetical protein